MTFLVKELLFKVFLEDYVFEAGKTVMFPDYHKIVQSINYFARQHGNLAIGKLVFLKLMFLADRYHVRMYGRLISNSHYLAMKYGPVASESKNTFEFLELPEGERKYACEFLEPVSRNIVKSVRDVQDDVFSETDREALNVAWLTYRRYPKIVDYTHRFPEWKKHIHELVGNKVVTMDLNDFFLPVDDDYCPATGERLELNRECFHEMMAA
ncbi:MAG: SocA family protein [Victivallales bacterium]|nr:SocA family protein [Victivallales bacterium]